MIKQVRQIIRGLVAYRFLIWQLVRTSILGSYKKSFIGMAWMFILPLMAVAVWVVLHSSGIVNPGDTSEVPYPVYVLLSTSIWGFFLELYRSVSQVLVGSGRLLIMKDFPGEVLVVSKLLEHLINFIVPLMINIIVLLAFGIQFKWPALLFLFSLLPLLLLGLSIGMVIAVFRVVAVDFATIVDEGMKLVMFLTPVVYTAKVGSGWLAEVVRWNPLTYLIGFSRDLLTKGEYYEMQRYFLCAAMSLVCFGIALAFFRTTAKRVLERLTLV
jgi:lipopolysaccharide transport system permease protein